MTTADADAAATTTSSPSPTATANPRTRRARLAQARAFYPLLREHAIAGAKGALAFSHLAETARARHPTDADVQKAYAITVGDALKLLREALLAKGLPDLSLLAGNKAYVPKAADLEAIRAGNFADRPDDLYDLLPAADQALLDAPAPQAEPPKAVVKKPTRTEALELLAKHAKAHPESVANMPKPHIAQKRDAVLKLLMDGRAPADAFLEGFGPPPPPPPPAKGKHH